MTARHDVRTGRTGRWLRRGVLVLIVALLGALAFGVVSGRYEIRPVLSGSMRPGLPVGGVVLAEKVPTASLHVRDVIIFHRPGHPSELVVHRITTLSPSAAGPVIQTQGDANDVPDPWKVTLQGSTAYRAKYSVPLVGYAAIWAHEPQTRRLALLLAALLAVAVALSQLLRRVRRASRVDEPDSEPDSEPYSESVSDESTDASADEPEQPGHSAPLPVGVGSGTGKP
jgi:signal peptidase I